MSLPNIAGYVRISNDDEPEQLENTSIENQKHIITQFVNTHFPKAPLTFFEDRDISGHTFERKSYQRMRKRMLNREFDILIVKDFSRLCRTMSLGFNELAVLKEHGVQIISINDNMTISGDLHFVRYT